MDVGKRSRREEVLRVRSERDALTGLVGRVRSLHLVSQPGGSSASSSTTIMVTVPATTARGRPAPPVLPRRPCW